MLTRRETVVDGGHANPVVRYVSPLLEDLGIRHGFSTRLGGVSDGVFTSMNLGNPSGCDVQDTPEHLAENHRRLFAASTLPAACRHARVHQVHGVDVVRVTPRTDHNPHAKADALVSDDPASVISVRVADCVPVLLATHDGAIVAAVHAGWRGVVGGVLAATIEHTRGLASERGNAGSSVANLAKGEEHHPASLVAAIGPSISLDAFEVGPEVVDEFAKVFTPSELERIVRPPLMRASAAPSTMVGGSTPHFGKPHIDLREALTIQLLRAGVPPHHIDTTDRCTFRDSHEFFSHRRDHGVTGRLAAFIAPLPTPRSSPASHP